MKIRVCIPFYSEFQETKPGLKELLQYSGEHKFYIEPRQGTYISETRNSLVNDNLSCNKLQKLELGFDAYLFIDSDIAFTLDHVLKMIDHNKNVITLPYQTHVNPREMQCGTFTETPGEVRQRANINQSGLHQVDWCGMGMTLIKAYIFEYLEYPWFRHKIIKKGNQQTECGEDIGFCVEALNNKINIWCDFDRPVAHRLRTNSQYNWSY